MAGLGDIVERLQSLEETMVDGFARLAGLLELSMEESAEDDTSDEQR